MQNNVIKMRVQDVVNLGGGGSDELWYPTVSEEGVVSWEKSSSETTPEARNIMGPAGATGPQGPAGNDYVLTTQDKEDIADIVISELTIAEEQEV